MIQKRSYLMKALLMRISFLVIFSHAFHFTLHAQSDLLQQKISLKLNNISIEAALDSLEKVANCYFTYDAELFKNRDKSNLIVENQNLSNTLRKLIPDKNLSFHVTDKHIVIVPGTENDAPNNTTEIIPYISYRTISGRITEKGAKKPLPYASVGVRGKLIGTISNQDGEFTLNLTADNIKDTLVFSYVGYQNYELKVADLTENTIHVHLKKDFISLQEVIIRNNDPVALVHAAVKRLDENYPDYSSNLTSFYRESVLKNNKYMIYLESVLNIFKGSYTNDYPEERVKVFKSRKIYDVSRLDTISFRLKGGIQGCLQIDIMKNIPEFLDPDLMHLYHYRLADISTYNNKSVYIIEFTPLPNHSEPLLKGKLYIETDKLAIIRAEFGYDRYRLHELKNRFLVKRSAKTKVKPLLVNYVVSYRNINGKYYFNHALGNLKFKVRNKKKLFSNNFSTSFEMAVTDVKTENVEKFKHREIIQPTTIFSNQQTSYDPKFWGKSNYIKPEESIQEALQRISNSMQQIALGKELEN